MKLASAFNKEVSDSNLLREKLYKESGNCKPCSTHGGDELLLAILNRKFRMGMGNLGKENGLKCGNIIKI